MRKLLQYLLRKPIIWLSKRFDSRPDKNRIYEALTNLHQSILKDPGKKGPIISLKPFEDKIIIFSDQHKGARNGADDFINSEENYIAALNYYNNNEFCFINLGDCEELWENTLGQVKKYNQKPFDAEKKFLKRKAFFKIFGNHDLYWANDPLASFELAGIFGERVDIHEAVIITLKINEKDLQIFCTHGHQGDANSDGNWLVKFFIARIWGPLQAYLKINTNEPSNNIQKKTIHNEIMYEWSAAQTNTILITGHTHQPVFESLTHIERLKRKLQIAKNKNDTITINGILDEMKVYQTGFDNLKDDYSKIVPTYFNTGCCCFSDGDITGIEIEGGYIRLVKWRYKKGSSERVILEEMLLSYLI